MMDEGGPFVVCVIGKKNSGKTTLTVALVAELAARGHRVMTVKHGHGFDLDTPGTDSWRHRHEGGASRVVMAGPHDMAIVGEWGPDGEPGLETIVRRFLPDAEVVVAEGYKAAALPKIEVFRQAAHADPIYERNHPLAVSFVAIVTDVESFVADVPVLPLDAPDLVPRLADLVEARRGHSRPVPPPSGRG
jgi:molybdopterin-guanine dinucleotide biosynthesis protein B